MCLDAPTKRTTLPVATAVSTAMEHVLLHIQSEDSAYEWKLESSTAKNSDFILILEFKICIILDFSHSIPIKLIGFSSYLLGFQVKRYLHLWESNCVTEASVQVSFEAQGETAR